MDCVSTKRGGGPKTPLCEGKGPENPGVVAPFCCCELSRQPQALSRQSVVEVRPTSLPSSPTVVVQLIDKVLNFPAVLRRHGTHRPTFQKTDEFPQVQFLDKLHLLNGLVVTVQTAVEVAWGPCGDSAGADIGQIWHARSAQFNLRWPCLGVLCSS